MINYPQEYFEDEVIDGFYVPAIMKQLWGVNLDILEEIDRVCKKHGIKYFADWGSLLAAVRHQGNIPWDDDIDICMLRADYERFIEVAKTELAPGFEAYNNDNRDEHWLFLARVINKNRICFEDEHLKRFHNFPYIASVDIFVLDYWFKDEAKRKQQKDDFYFTYALAEKAEEINVINDNIEFRLRHIEAITGEKIDRSLRGIYLKRRLFKLCEHIMARCSAEEADAVSQLVPFGFTSGRHFDKAVYESTVTLPYDQYTIEAPVFYNSALKNHYSSYTRIIKSWNGHDYPHFKKQYENLTKVMDMNGFAYHFEREQLREFAPAASGEGQLESNQTSGYKPLCVECYNGLFELLSGAYESDDVDEIISILQESQQLAIDLGSLIEQARGEGTAAVKSLEEYCEALYQVCSGAADMSILADCINSIGKTLNAEILSKKEIVFLTVKPAWWHFFEPIYKQYSSDPEWEVKVLSLPYFYKNYDGTVNAEHVLEGEYPAELSISDCDAYDLLLNHPDIIVSQSSFDQWNPSTSVMSAYYSDKLQAATDRLIYIPPYDVEDFTPKHENDYYNLASFLCMPGAIRADEIWVASEVLRSTYVQKLVEFAGEEYRSIFEQKLKVAPQGVFSQADSNLAQKETGQAPHTPTIIYFIGADYLAYGKEEALEKLRRNFELLGTDSEDNGTKVIFSPHPSLESVSKREVPKLYAEYMEFKAGVSLAKFVEIDDITNMARQAEFLSKASAYFGDISPLAMKLARCHKPVMIQEIK